MEMIPLKAAVRDIKANPKALRRSQQIPCVVYGNSVQLNVQCPAKDLHSAFVKAGESTLVELDVAGKSIPVLFKSVDFDPVTDREIHADFYAVNMKAEIETLVPVHFEGEAPAIKTLGGVFVIAHDHVKVRCLPGQLPKNIVVSVAGLEAFHMSVAVKDLQVPEGVKIMDAPGTVLATVQEPRAVEEIVTTAPVAAEGDATAAAAGTEGAAAAGAAPAAGADAAAKEKSGGKDKK